MKKKVTIIVVSILLILILIFSLFKILNKDISSSNIPKDYKGPLSGQINEDIERITKKVDIKEGTIVLTNEINLDTYSDNITIKKGGKYTLSGSLDATVRIDTSEKVNLVLNNATIKGKNTSAIINLQSNDLTIYLNENTINYIEDNGNSEYDAAIFSNGNIILDGTGELNVKCNQIYSEGIATNDKDITIKSGKINIESTDDGINAGGESGGIININGGTIYIKAVGDAIDSNNKIIINDGILYATGGETGTDGALDSDNGIIINGGVVVALGYNHMEMPLENSSQYVLGINLSENIDDNVNITLVNEYNFEIISFITKQKINKIMISLPDLSDGNYKLYKNVIHSGNLDQGIYSGNVKELKDLIVIKNNENIEVYKNITEINGTNKGGIRYEE